jgi:RNA polymerase sigma factor (sigma-70 family)
LYFRMLCIDSQARERRRRNIDRMVRQLMTTKIDRRSAVDMDEAAELMRKVAGGDKEAFARLYQGFCPILRRFFADYNGHRVPLDDFLQEVFMRLWEHRNNYHNTSCFLAYLLGIARHTFYEEIRKSQKIAAVRLKECADVRTDSLSDLSRPEAELAFSELVAALKRVRARLTAKQREAIELSQAPEVSLGQAAQELGCSRTALQCRLKRARKRLRELLARALGNEQASNPKSPAQSKSKGR